MSEKLEEARDSVTLRFFPALKGKDPIRIGRVVFWSFPSEINNFLPSWAHEQVRKIANLFYDNLCKPLDELVCSTILDPAPEEPRVNLCDEIDNAAKILLYGQQTITYGSSPIRIDHFEGRTFSILENDDKELVQFTGLGHSTIVPLDGNFHYSLSPFIRQETLGIPENNTLMLALSIITGRLQDEEVDATEKDEKRRLLRAIDWFNQSGYRYSAHTIETLVVNSATALEALLDLPRDGIAQAFRNVIILLLGENEELSRWCKKFYNVRSKIVHGSATESILYGAKGFKPHLSHLDFSRSIFDLCLKAILTSRNLLPSDPLNNSIHQMFLERLVPNEHRLREIASVDVSIILSDRKFANRFGNTLAGLDYYETASISPEMCDGAISKIKKLIGVMCSKLEESLETEAKESVGSINTIVQDSKVSSNSLFDLPHKIERIHQGDLDRVDVQGISLWKAVDTLRTLLDMKQRINDGTI